jgi:hypothetical protein
MERKIIPDLQENCMEIGNLRARYANLINTPTLDLCDHIHMENFSDVQLRLIKTYFIMHFCYQFRHFCFRANNVQD